MCEESELVQKWTKLTQGKFMRGVLLSLEWAFSMHLGDFEVLPNATVVVSLELTTF